MATDFRGVPFSESDYDDWQWEPKEDILWEHETYEPTEEDFAAMEEEMRREEEEIMEDLWDEQELAREEWERDMEKIRALGYLEAF